jgi:RNA polymerase sigma-70 factor, ECF subfamily
MSAPIPESVTLWLRNWQAGDAGALERLTELVYADLRRLAASYLRDERPGHTLQATALVHELYLKLASARETDWKGRSHFIAVSAQMMRRILIDHARRRNARKRQTDGDLPFAPGQTPDCKPDLLEIDLALNKMTTEYPRHARIVELRFFGGLETPEIAEVLDVSSRTVERDWHFAKAWLQNEVSGS